MYYWFTDFNKKLILRKNTFKTNVVFSSLTPQEQRIILKKLKALKTAKDNLDDAIETYNNNKSGSNKDKLFKQEKNIIAQTDFNSSNITEFTLSR